MQAVGVNSLRGISVTWCMTTQRHPDPSNNEAAFHQFSLRDMFFGFVAVAFTCLLFSVYQKLTPGYGSPELRLLANVYNGAMAASFGIAVAGAIAGYSRGILEEYPFPVYPGHWLLLLGAAAVAINTVATMLVYTVLGVEHARGLHWEPALAYYELPSRMHHASSLGVGAIVCIGAARLAQRQLNSAWTWLLILYGLLATALAAWNALPFFVDVNIGGRWWWNLSSIHVGCISAGLIMLERCVMRDLRGGFRYDKLHWVGIIITATLAIIQISISFPLAHYD